MVSNFKIYILKLAYLPEYQTLPPRRFSSTGDMYYVGLATTTPPGNNQPFLKIPILKNDSITFKLIVNDETVYMGVKLITTGIDEPAKKIIQIYPNPAKSCINISFSDNAVENSYSVRIMNMTGQEVYRSLIKNKLTRIDVAKWTTKGIYLVHLTNEFGETVEVKKIVVQ